MGHRFFRHGELPLVLLALLAERPMHGYDLMAELGRLEPDALERVLDRTLDDIEVTAVTGQATGEETRP